VGVGSNRRLLRAAADSDEHLSKKAAGKSKLWRGSSSAGGNRLGTFKHFLKIPRPLKNQFEFLGPQSTICLSEHLNHEKSYCGAICYT